VNDDFSDCIQEKIFLVVLSCINKLENFFQEEIRVAN